MAKNTAATRALAAMACGLGGHQLRFRRVLNGTSYYRCRRCNGRFQLKRADTHTAYRSAETGEYVTADYATAHPDTTVQEQQ